MAYRPSVTGRVAAKLRADSSGITDSDSKEFFIEMAETAIGYASTCDISKALDSIDLMGMVSAGIMAEMTRVMNMGKAVNAQSVVNSVKRTKQTTVGMIVEYLEQKCSCQSGNVR